MNGIKIDYLTITGRGDYRYQFPVPEGWDSEQPMAWQAGPAVYSGFAWEYPNGHLHKLWSEEQGMLIRISGSLCEQVWPNISLSNLRLTRLDLRVDVEEEINLLQW